MKSRIIVAEDDPITRMDICEMLTNVGYDIVGEATDGLQAIDLCRKYRPDLVLMDINMPRLDGIQAAQLIMSEDLVDSLMILTAYSGKEFIEKVKELGALGYIVKPIDETKLIPQIEIAISKGKQIRDIKNNFIKIQKDLENTKIIHKAKEMLMEHFSLSENNAYKKLRKLSMNKQCSILESSMTIVDYYKKNTMEKE